MEWKKKEGIVAKKCVFSCLLSNPHRTMKDDDCPLYLSVLIIHPIHACSHHLWPLFDYRVL